MTAACSTHSSMLYRSTFHQSTTLWHLHKHKHLTSYPKAESPACYMQACMPQYSYEPGPKNSAQHALPSCRLDCNGRHHRIDNFLRRAGILLEQLPGLPVQAVSIAIRCTPSKRAKVRVVSRQTHVEDG